MASGTQQHLYQQQRQQGQQHQQDLPMPQQQPDNQMQFITDDTLGTGYDPQQQQQPQHQAHQIDAMSPITSTSMSIDHSHGHMATMNIQQQTDHMLNPVINAAQMNQELCNQTTTQHHLQTQQQQKSHLLPLLLSPRPTGLKFPDRIDRPESDHDQIIEQVISLENEFSDPSVAMTNVDNNSVMVMSGQSQQHPFSDTNLSDAQCAADKNQLSNSSEDLLNLLLEFDRDSSNLINSDQQLDQDEKVGIETIRKQLMSCEVQSDQILQPNTTSSMSPVVDQLNGSQSIHVRSAQQSHHNLHQQQVTQQTQLISQAAPVISPHKQPQHQISSSGLSQQQRQQQLPQHHRLSVDQTLLHGPYSNAHLGAVPITTSGQPYTTQQHQNLARISQSTPMTVENNSPSPSWHQTQLSPFSPQSTNNDPNRPPSSQLQQHPTMHPLQQQHPTATSPQIQHLHHPLQRRSPSQSISPPVSTEPSPVVKKNPLLNAQLVNSRAPSIAPSRFMDNQANVLNQNPILNSKLSQSSFVSTRCNTVGSPINQSLPQQTRFVQQPQQQPDYNYDITQQQNAQHVSPQPGYMSMYGHNEHTQQQANQVSRTSTITTTASSCIPPRGIPQLAMGSTSPSGGLSQQVKQEIRKKVQQPKQQHQTTSLLKQLLSDDNK